jgi:hypothetical protein
MDFKFRESTCVNIIIKSLFENPKNIQKIENKKDLNEELTEEYLKKNTRACPKCNIHVYKFDGCHHMKCNTSFHKG